jgi:hypothetical protein
MAADILALRRLIEHTAAGDGPLPEGLLAEGLLPDGPRWDRARQARLAGLAAVQPALRGQSAAPQPLPVVAELRGLLPGGGLRRGGTVAVVPGSTSLLLALLVAASQAGSWCAIVGMPALGAVAAAEIGVDLSRLALVPNPGPEWPSVVAALIDGMDIVVAAPPGPVAGRIASRLSARARQRGCVLMPYGRWEGAEVTLAVIGGEWQGVGQGHGRLRSRQVTITARGRGAASRPKQARLWLPGPAGVPAPFDPPERLLASVPAAEAV